MKDELEKLLGLRIVGIDWRELEHDALTDVRVVVEGGQALDLHTTVIGDTFQARLIEAPEGVLPPITDRPWEGVRTPPLNLADLELDMLPPGADPC